MKSAELMISLIPQWIYIIFVLSVNTGVGSVEENSQSTLGVEHAPLSRYRNAGLINYAKAQTKVCYGNTIKNELPGGQCKTHYQFHSDHQSS